VFIRVHSCSFVFIRGLNPDLPDTILVPGTRLIERGLRLARRSVNLSA